MKTIIGISIILLLMTLINVSNLACSGHDEPPDVTTTPAITPNSSGGKIAFLSDRDGNAEIYIMNADGSNQVNITNNSAWDSLPCLSPDGTKLAFSSDRVGDVELYIMDLNSSTTMRLTDMED